MRNSSAIYPFNSALFPYIQKFDLLQDKYSLDAIFSPSGFGLINKNAGYCCNKNNTNMIISDEKEVTSSKYNTLLVNRLSNTHALEHSNMVNTMERGIISGKSVIYYDFTKDNITTEIQKLQDRFFEKVTIQVENLGSHDDLFSDDKYNELSTPILLVGGLIECPDILNIVLSITTQFIKNGLRPSVVIKEPIGQLFGFHTIHHFLNSPRFNEVEKIKKINRYISAIESFERPDIIILEAPDAVMKFNNSEPNGFGILTYMLSMAVQPDIFVCCNPLDMVANSFITALSKDFEVRLGTPIHAVHVSNVIVDPTSLDYSHLSLNLYVDQNLVTEILIKEGSYSSIPLINIDTGDEEKLYKIVKDCIQAL